MSSCNMACIELLRFLVWQLAKNDEVEVLPDRADEVDTFGNRNARRAECYPFANVGRFDTLADWAARRVCRRSVDLQIK